MEILFISFSVITLGGVRGARSMAMLEALADAGHRIDLISPRPITFTHSNIHSVSHTTKGFLRRFQICWLVIWLLIKKKYDVVHCCDAAALYVLPFFRPKGVKLVYDALRRVLGNDPVNEPLLWRVFPKKFKRREQKVVSSADLVLSTCSALTSDLQSLSRDRDITQIEDVPEQYLCSLTPPEEDPCQIVGNKPSGLVVCCCLAELDGRCRKLLVAARKVLDMDASVAFVFKGLNVKKAEAMARHLDITGRCRFLSMNESESYLFWLQQADVALFVPPEKSRYIHPEIYTQLYSEATVVGVSNTAYAGILTDTNSIAVVYSAESIAEGLIRALREPLFSRVLAVEGRRLMVEHHSFSSFKHKVRMAYRGLENSSR